MLRALRASGFALVLTAFAAVSACEHEDGGETGDLDLPDGGDFGAEGGGVVDASSPGANDGGAGAGACLPQECPGVDTECSSRICFNGACAVRWAAAGTTLKAQVIGDCKQARCDDSGNVTTVTDDTDTPANENPCRTETCSGGSVLVANAPEDTPCGTALACDGQGACVGCTSPADCPGTDTDCRTRTCVAGACGFSHASAGAPVTAQTAGDCLKRQCDGHGNVQNVVDDTDLPNDGQDCTNGVCTGGTPSHSPAAPGTSCAQNGGSVCNGAGVCVQCIAPETCPGTNTACRTRTCIANACGFSFADAGTTIPTQTVGDCKVNRCNGEGAVVAVAADDDLPFDGLQCTFDICTGGTPTNSPVPEGMACTQNGGTRCNATGACVQCLVPADCPGVDTACQTRTCISNQCGVANVPAGTPLPEEAQVAGDCKERRCNGAGGVVTVNSDGDLPVDSNECTADVCTAGVPTNPALPMNTPCNQGGGQMCSASATCVECNVPSDCPGSDTACTARTCIAHACGTANAPPGTPIASQSTGDCHERRCDASGNVVDAVHDADVPVDADPCTLDLCQNGAPSNPPAPVGTPCSRNGGTSCDGAGNCVAVAPSTN